MNPVTVLGAQQFEFPCKIIFFVELQLNKFWIWAETKTVFFFFLCTIKPKVSDEFQTFWIFSIFTENKNNPRLCVGHSYPGIEHEHANMLNIQNFQILKQINYKFLLFSMPSSRSKPTPISGKVKTWIFQGFEEIMDSQAKKSFFLFCPLKFVFLLLKAKLLAKAFRYPKHIYKHVEHHWKLSLVGVKVDKPK